MILLLKMVPRHNVEVLSNVPRCKKAIMCLMEKIYVLEKFQSGLTYGATGHEFNANELTRHIK